MKGGGWALYGTTHGIRYHDGYFYVYLCWHHWKTRQWCSGRTLDRKKYKTLERALKQLKASDCVMIFPPLEVKVIHASDEQRSDGTPID